MLQNYNFFIFSPKFSFDRIESFRFRFCAEKLNFAAVDHFFFDLVSEKSRPNFSSTTGHHFPTQRLPVMH